MEQGTHGELLALNGVFASMWADQVHGSEDGAPSSHGGEAGDGDAREDTTKGYTVTEEVEQENLIDLEREAEPEPTSAATEKPTYAAVVAEGLTEEPSAESSSIVSTTQAPEPSTKSGSTPAAEAASAVEPTASETEAIEEAPKPVRDVDVPVAFPRSPSEETSAPVTFPASESTPSEVPAAPVSFPAAQGDDAASQAPSGVEAAPAVATPGVTFSPDVASPSPRSGTPDPNAEPKRKRISSQNFQRLARRISISGRRGSSQSTIPNLIPSLKRGDSTPRDSTSKDGEDTPRGEASTSGTAAEPSPEPSVQGDKKDKKKGKKEKRKTLF